MQNPQLQEDPQGVFHKLKPVATIGDALLKTGGTDF